MSKSNFKFLTTMFYVCNTCKHRDGCLMNGIPNEERLQDTMRKDTIWLPEDCPLKQRGKEQKVKVIFT